MAIDTYKKNSIEVTYNTSENKPFQQVKIKI
jgi:hypothetical protein